MYSPTDLEANIRNGYMIETKSKMTGFVLVFLFGPLGALYFGPAKAIECFGWWIVGLVCTIASIFFPLAGLGAVLAGFMMIGFWISIFTDHGLSHDLTESGKIAKAQYEAESLARLDENIDKVKQKAGAFINNLGKKIVSATEQSQTQGNQRETADYVEPVQHETATIFQVTTASTFCSECGSKQTSVAKFCNGCGCKIEKAA
jgi:hypothetical protein